jgi:hypothetical protein
MDKIDKIKIIVLPLRPCYFWEAHLIEFGHIKFVCLKTFLRCILLSFSELTSLAHLFNIFFYWTFLTWQIIRGRLALLAHAQIKYTSVTPIQLVPIIWKIAQKTRCFNMRMLTSNYDFTPIKISRVRCLHEGNSTVTELLRDSDFSLKMYAKHTPLISKFKWSGLTPGKRISSLVPDLYYTEMHNYGYECHIVQYSRVQYSLAHYSVLN